MSSPLYRYFLYLDRNGVGLGYGTAKRTGHWVKAGSILGRRTFATKAEAEAERVKWREKLPERILAKALLPTIH